MARNTLQELKKRLKIRRSPPAEQIIKQIILHTFEQMHIKAEAESKCELEQVGCSILEIDMLNEIVTHYAATNGPVVDAECFGVKDCGCIHAAANTVLKYLKSKAWRVHRKNIKAVLISTHFLCKQCASLIIASGLIDIVIHDGYDDYGAEWLNYSNVRLWTKDMIEEDIENKHIKNWLLKIK